MSAYRLIVEITEVLRRLPEEDAKSILLLCYILEAETSELHTEIRTALRQRDFERVEKLLHQLMAR